MGIIYLTQNKIGLSRRFDGSMMGAWMLVWEKGINALNAFILLGEISQAVCAKLMNTFVTEGQFPKDTQTLSVLKMNIIYPMKSVKSLCHRGLEKGCIQLSIDLDCVVHLIQNNQVRHLRSIGR